MEINSEYSGKIIISRTDKIGDIILALPLISECRRIYKNLKIYFLTSSIIKDLLEGYEDIDEIIYYDKLNTFREKLKFIRRQKFDISISVFPRFEIALLFFLSGIKSRIGTAYRWYSFLFNKRVKEHRKKAEKHEAQYNLNLLKSISNKVKDELNFKFKYQPDERTALRNKLLKYNLDIDERYIIIHPGSKGSAIDLPAETLIQFARDFSAEYNNIKIILTGTSEERIISENFFNRINSPDNVIILNGEINLRELMILIDSSSLFISNSTGPIHIAGALNKRIIGFYPKTIPMNAERWGPLSVNTVILTPKNDSKMSQISSEDIKSAAKKLLNY
jgi:ADP-heptose:LPS heptosyltransferase